MALSAQIRRQVIDRAENRCEYCGLSAAAQEAAFHVDHIIPLVMGGLDSLDNLALACVSCSLRKGARHRVLDTETYEWVAVFHPRQEFWGDHFKWDGALVVGLTPIGRATVRALNMNRPLAVAIRHEEIIRGRQPR